MNNNITLREKWQALKQNLKRKKIMLPIVLLWRLMKFVVFRMPLYIPSHISGLIVLHKLISDKQDNEIVLVIRHGMGDLLYGMSMIDGVLKKFPDKKILIIANRKYKEVIESYPANDRIIFKLQEYTKSYMRKQANFMFFKGLPEKGWSKDVIDCIPRHYQVMLGYLIDSPRFIGTIYRLRRNIFDLPDDTPIRYHGFKPDKSLISIPDFEAIKHKIVLINPYSNSMIYTKSIYEEIVGELNRRGYVVFTNVVGEQKAVEGSLPLRCDLKEIYSIACNIPLVVSVRSGFLDLLATSGVNIFAIYDRAEYSYFSCPLHEWKSSGRVEEVVIRNWEEKVLLPEIFSRFLDELKQEGRLS